MSSTAFCGTVPATPPARNASAPAAWLFRGAHSVLADRDRKWRAKSRWPSFWLWAVQALSPAQGQKTAECDIFEALPLGTTGPSSQAINTMHNWENSKDYAAQTNLFNTGNNNLQVSLVGSTESAQPDNAWHTYGCLWTSNGNGSGTVQFYYDGFLIVHQGGVTTFLTGTNQSGLRPDQREQHYRHRVDRHGKRQPLHLSRNGPRLADERRLGPRLAGAYGNCAVNPAPPEQKRLSVMPPPTFFQSASSAKHVRFEVDRMSSNRIKK